MHGNNFFTWHNSSVLKCTKTALMIKTLLVHLNRTYICLSISVCMRRMWLPLWSIMSSRRGTGEGSQSKLFWFSPICLLILTSPCEGFLPNFWSQVVTLSWDSQTHQFITEKTILNVTLEVLRSTMKQPAEEKVSSLCSVSHDAPSSEERTTAFHLFPDQTWSQLLESSEGGGNL